jgi:hypothetical protein
VTVKLNADPAVAEAGADTLKRLAAAGDTEIVPLVPSIDELAVSVAAIVWLPAILKVALNVPVPLVNVLSAGRMAFPSLLVKWTVPV